MGAFGVGDAALDARQTPARVRAAGDGRGGNNVARMAATIVRVPQRASAMRAVPVAWEVSERGRLRTDVADDLRHGRLHDVEATLTFRKAHETTFFVVFHELVGFGIDK